MSPRKPSRPAPPARLAPTGKRLWRSIVKDLPPEWELDQRERELLARACRCADELDKLEKTVDREGPTVNGSRGQVVVHPALQEARQLRLVQLRLLSALELSDPAEGPATPAQARGRRAAETAWKRRRGARG